jgi:hypothetical protein
VPRPLTRLILLLVVVAVLAVAADRVSAYVAARSVAQGLTSSQQLSRPATVSFRGIPFLTQALRGRYDTVDITMEGLPTASGLVVDRIDATLHGVSAPPDLLLRDRLTALPVEQAAAVVVVSFTSLELSARRVRGTQLVSLVLARAAANRVVITAALVTPLGRFAVRGQAELSVSRGTVAVRLLPHTLAITGVGSLLPSQVANLVNLTTLVPKLPFGFRATAVSVDDTGLRLQAAGSALSMLA